MTRVNPTSQPTASPTWRMNAVRLAHEHGLVGKAFQYRDEPTQFEVPSSSDPVPHVVRFNANNSTVACDCQAAVHGKPCGHAGAVLMLVCRLCPEYRAGAQ